MMRAFFCTGQGLRQDPINRIGRDHPRKTLVKPSVVVGQVLVIEAHEAEDGGV